MAKIKEWEELTICDNFLFQKVMQNKRLCKHLIQKLLKISVKRIIYPAAEKSIAIGATSKSVRLDLYVETDDGIRCHESDSLELGDETAKIFLNAKGTIGDVDADIASFLDYVDGKTAEGKFTKDIAAEVERVKQHDETRLEYMTLMMELKQQRREGQEEERRNTAIRMIKAWKLSLEEIAEYLALPLKSVMEIKKSIA